jgi:hypothetical protein
VADIDVKLSAQEPIVERDGNPTLKFQRKWQLVVEPQTYSVASLPATAKTGALSYATDLRVFDGAGTQETAGNGTGGHVTFTGAAWVITGTNITAVA